MSVGETESDKQTDRCICKDTDLKLETLAGQGGAENKELGARTGIGIEFHPSVEFDLRRL